MLNGPKIFVLLSVFALATLVACGDDSDGDGGTSPGGPEACADRTGGALIEPGEPDPHTDTLWLWVEDDAFIDEATSLQQTGRWRVPNFAEVVATKDCDPTHVWHVDPSQMEWSDFAAEECDALISYVSDNLADWTARPTPNWCPWGGRVLEVIDRR